MKNIRMTVTKEEKELIEAVREKNKVMHDIVILKNSMPSKATIENVERRMRDEKLSELYDKFTALRFRIGHLI